MPANVTALRAGAAAATEEFVTVVPQRQMMIFHAFLHTHDAKTSPNRHQQRRGREESNVGGGHAGEPLKMSEKFAGKQDRNAK